MRSFIRIYSYIVIVISVVLSTSWLWYQNIYFHTDIARDFLILEDIYFGHHISLLGPRAGGIEGVFHGPLWFYLNLPAYIAGKGNPVYVGWFWIMLLIILIVMVYVIGKKIMNNEIGLLASALLSVALIDITKMLLNPFGAIIVSPLIFYYFYRYVQEDKARDLMWFVLWTGIAIQFEMAFGIPIFILGFLYTLVLVYKTRKWNHIAGYLVILLPLSTFILFDIRHQFLQTNAVMSYLMQHKGGSGYTLSFIWSRIQNLLDVTNMFAAQQVILSWIVALLTLYMLFIDRKRTEKLKNSLWLFIYFYTGHAIISFFLFKGNIQSYYTAPFLPLFAIVFIGTATRHIYKPLLVTLILAITFFGIQKGVREMVLNANTSVSDGSAWQFNLQLAKDIYANNKNKSFSYYVYTPDLFGYGPRYAMNYMQRQTKKTDVYPYEKKDIVYLIMSPAPFHSALGPEDWKKNEVKINRNPDKKITYPNGYIVEMYKLTKEEQSVESNPNMIQSVIMR